MGKENTGRWSSKENSLFNYARKQRLSWKAVAEYVGTRNADQCRSHNQKMKMCAFNNREYQPVM